MTVGSASPELLRSRLLTVVGTIVLAVVAALSIWPHKPDYSWFVAMLGVYVAAVGGFAVAASLAWLRRRDHSTRFIATRNGLAVRPAVLPGLMAGLLMSLLGLQVGILVRVWRGIAAATSTIAIDVEFASVMSIVVIVTAAVTAMMVSFAWGGFAVELTPAGISSRGPLHRRLIPWQAVAGLPRPDRNAKLLRLVVDQPQLVVQRGWHGFTGTRQHPTLAVDASAWQLAEAIRWYVEHPADRAAIGTRAGHDRLITEVGSAQSATEAEPLAPPTPATADAAMRPAKTRHVGTATALVYVTVAVALLAAAAELVIAIVFRENLLAAEQAVAGRVSPLPPAGDQADGLIFRTDTVSFATAWATAALIGTFLAALVAIALARSMSRGSDPARVGLAVLSGITALAAMCTLFSPVTGLAAEPAAGTLLNLWPVYRLLLSFAVAGTAVAVLMLLWTGDVVAYTRARSITQPVDRNSLHDRE